MNRFPTPVALLLGTTLAPAQSPVAPARDPFQGPLETRKPVVEALPTPGLPGGPADLHIQSVRVVGIAVCGDRRIALIRAHNGTTVFLVKEGTTLQDGLIASIQTDRIGLRFSGPGDPNERTPRLLWRSLLVPPFGVVR